MKNNKSLKIIFITMLITILVTIYTPLTYAGEIFSGADGFITDGQTGSSPIEDSALQTTSSTIYNILLIIGIVLAVIIGVILGIQFMVGSVEQKSKVKESLIPYVVGCIVIFGAFGIWKLVVTILAQID